MKILILANSQQNVEAIKNDIANIDKYHQELGWKCIEDLNKHEVHAVNDLIFFQQKHGIKFCFGKSIWDWETDNPENKVDEEQYDLIVVYYRFLDDGSANPPKGLIQRILFDFNG